MRFRHRTQQKEPIGSGFDVPDRKEVEQIFIIHHRLMDFEWDTHGVEDGKESHTDIGEYGSPQIGKPQGTQ